MRHEIISIPVRTVNALNVREHWARRAKRAKSERELAYIVTPKTKPPVQVTLTRVAPRAMDDDGLAASFKAIRDGIADKIGVNDGSDQIHFWYRQRKGKPREYAVEIKLEAMGIA